MKNAIKNFWVALLSKINDKINQWLNAPKSKLPTMDGFYKGYEEMKKQLQPKKILCYGTVPEEIKDEVQGIGCHWERRFKNGR